MIRSHATLAYITGLVVVLLASSAVAQNDDYKPYVRTSSNIEYFEITFDEDYLEVTVPVGDGFETDRYDLELIDVVRKSRVTAEGTLLFDSSGLHFRDTVLPYDDIYETVVAEYDDHFVITFFRRENVVGRVERIKRGNRIEPFGSITVPEGDFARGIVLTVTGDVNIAGEVNKDVISLFGNITVSEVSAVRGDLVSITGEIEVERGASLHGDVFSGTDDRRRNYRKWRAGEEFDFAPLIEYNRVDGLMLAGRVRYSDADSLLPTMHAAIGIGFEADRGRYEVGLEQVILSDPQLVVGGSAYRWLMSEDDWLLSDDENIAFTLLVTEDFKDYYEAEGGTVFARIKPLSNLTGEFRYRIEDTKWLRAHRHMWSLFGGDKLFDHNFGTVDESVRAASIPEIDTTENAHLTFAVTYDTRNQEDPFASSAWALSGQLEWSHPDFSSDFDYRRYTVNLRRYQKIHKRAMLLARWMYGGSDGYLPMYKRYFLGGLGTLRGYDHKEYAGAKFWMANVEYRFDFPTTDLAMSLLWDVGRITNDPSFDDADEVKHSLGIAAYFGEDLRVSLAKRLDRASDDDPKFFVRFAHVF